MRDGIVTINARPIRLAFLVNPTDVDSLQRVIEINTFLWGGKFNAIIPTFQDTPENWHHCPDMNAQDIVSGYLNNFDPDYVVPMVECSDYDLYNAIRYLVSLYKSVTRAAAVTESSQNFESRENYNIIRAYLLGIFGEQLATADDAIENWRDVLKEELEDLIQKLREETITPEELQDLIQTLVPDQTLGDNND